MDLQLEVGAWRAPRLLVAVYFSDKMMSQWDRCSGPGIFLSGIFLGSTFLKIFLVMLKWWWDGALAVECRRPWAPPRGGNCPHPRTNHHRYHWHFWSKRERKSAYFCPQIVIFCQQPCILSIFSNRTICSPIDRRTSLHKREKGCEFKFFRHR